MHGYFFLTKIPPYMGLLDTYTFIIFRNFGGQNTRRKQIWTLILQILAVFTLITTWEQTLFRIKAKLKVIALKLYLAMNCKISNFHSTRLFHPYTFINFVEIFHLSRLFDPTRLFGTKE